MSPGTGPLRLVLPPSLGRDSQARCDKAAASLGAVLQRSVTAYTAASYDRLLDDLNAGYAALGWAPPVICARAERLGLPILARGLRKGATTFRSALVALKKANLNLARLDGKRAAWVDRESAAGYLLARTLLKAKGYLPDEMFAEQRFHGSYKDALSAVLSGTADLTAVFAPPVGFGLSGQTGIDEILPERRVEFGVVAYSLECPNDGVVLGSAATSERAKLEEALLGLHRDLRAVPLLQEVLRVDRLDSPPAGTYRALLTTLAAP